MSVDYLALPYSHNDSEVRELRFQIACLATLALMAQGHIIICPVIHGHPLATYHSLPFDFSFWRTYNLEVLRKCDRLWVLCADGWKTSVGVQGEIAEAMTRKIPVIFFNMKGGEVNAILPEEESAKNNGGM